MHAERSICNKCTTYTFLSSENCIFSYFLKGLNKREGLLKDLMGCDAHKESSIMLLSVQSEYPNRDHNVTYFDSAGRSVLPRSVEEVGISAVKQKSQPWNGVGSDEDIAKVREVFASLIGASADCISLAPSTGFAMTLVAKNVVKSGNLTLGKVVVVLGKEMGSAVYPWQEACSETGASFRVVEDPFLAKSEMSWTEAILKAIDDSVAVVALPMVHWCNGAIIDLAAISARLDQFPKISRPLLVVDGTQSLGALPFSLNDIHADVVACSVHKWLNSPYGMSLLYTHPNYHNTWEPLDHHERGRVGSNEEGWDEIIHMHPETGFYPQALFPDARRFDAGGKANPVTVPMVLAGLQTVLSWSPAAVQEHCATLTDAIATQLQSLFGQHVLIRPKSQRSAHILGVRFCPTSPYHVVPLVELNKKLKKENVFVSVRGEWLRLSVYLHNSIADVNRFVSLFAQITARMRQSCPSLLTGGDAVGANSNVKKSAALRVLITGSAGWLAQFVTHSLLRHTIDACSQTNTDAGTSSSVTSTAAATAPIFELFHAYSDAVPHWVPSTHRVHLDLTDTSSIHTIIAAVRPDIIIHTAAVSSPVVSHKDMHKAYAVNCPTALIDAVQKCVPDALFVFTSTDMVYDGERAPYSVHTSDNSNNTVDFQPVNVYGATKLAFEREVLKLKHGTVLRLSNMIGAPYQYQPAGAKFLEWLFGAYSRREYVGLKQQEIRSFVHVHDVVRVITVLMEKYAHLKTSGESTVNAVCNGVYNAGGPEPLSRLYVARHLCRVLGTELVVHNTYQDSTDTSCREKREVDPSMPWVVYIMDPLPTNTDSCVGNTTCAAAAAAEGNIPVSDGSVTSAASKMFDVLRSPRDISMDSSTTENAFGKFSPIDAILLESLSGK